jgi:diguanylate cyclase (GGDEF)-like protein
VLPDTGAPEASRLAESIRGAIEACRQIEGEDVDLSRVTASIGVASFPDHAADAEGLFRRADDAMYGAKRAGRNRVAVASGPPGAPAASLGGGAAGAAARDAPAVP